MSHAARVQRTLVRSADGCADGRTSGRVRTGRTGCGRARTGLDEDGRVTDGREGGRTGTDGRVRTDECRHRTYHPPDDLPKRRPLPSHILGAGLHITPGNHSQTPTEALHHRTTDPSRPDATSHFTACGRTATQAGTAGVSFRGGELVTLVHQNSGLENLSYVVLRPTFDEDSHGTTFRYPCQ